MILSTLKSGIATFTREIKPALPYLKRHKYLAGLNIALIIIMAVSEVFGIGMIVPILQSLLGETEQDIFPVPYIRDLFDIVDIEFRFRNLMGMLAVMLAIRYTCEALQMYTARLLSQKVVHTMRKNAFKNLMDLPLSYHYTQKTGNMVATLHTSSLNAGGAIELISLTLGAIAICIAYLVFEAVMVPTLTGAVLGLFAVSILFLLPRYKLGFSHGREEKDLIDKTSSFLIDTFSGIKVVKSFHNEKLHVTKFNKLSSSFKNLAIRIQINTILSNIFTEPFMALTAIGLMGIAVEILHVSMYHVLTFFLVFLRLVPKIRMTNTSYLQILQLLPHFSKVEEMINRENKTYIPDGTRGINSFSSDIEFEHVYFKYPGASEELVLKDVNIKIQKNKTTAIVGTSGGGKSTLTDLLLRLHDPSQGLLKVDGKDLREFQLSDWHDLISLVPQDPHLFNDTIRNNILYGKLDANEDEAIEAAKIANAHEFIMQTPHGYDTVVGERAVTLSGGQKQRIAIARAIIKQPEILILDEATSALDSISEGLVQDAIDRISTERTTIIIAHRLSTIINADKIIVLQGGQVVEEGTHQELIGKKGYYWSLYQSPMKQQ